MSSSLTSQDSDAKAPSLYCRKEKSLGVLCSNFLKMYNRDGVDSIGLDNAALQLGVERRRIYDIVNILESIGVLRRKAKNQYTWKGFGAIPRALDSLKEEGLKEKFSASNHHSVVKLSDKYEFGGPLDSSTEKREKDPERAQKVDGRKEKSLGLLTQNFVKLFLCSNEQLISLDSAASALLGDIHDPTAMRTKVRRLYDIANVLASMNLIEKVRHPNSGKPAFRWIGHPMSASSATLNANNLKRRVFGSDITNTSSKRHKANFSFDRTLNEKENMQMHGSHDSMKDESNKASVEQHQKHGPKDIVFGPFTPASVLNLKSQDRKAGQIQEWENLAFAYRLRYCNQALSDLFAHYVEAWKLWYDEADEKQIKHVRSSPFEETSFQVIKDTSCEKMHSLPLNSSTRQ